MTVGGNVTLGVEWVAAEGLWQSGYSAGEAVTVEVLDDRRDCTITEGPTM